MIVNPIKLVYVYLSLLFSGLGLGLFVGILIGDVDKIILAIKITFPFIIFQYYFWYKSSGMISKAKIKTIQREREIGKMEVK